MEDVLFVVNPRAASGRASRVWAALRKRVQGLDSAAVVQCGEISQAEQVIAAALTPRIRRVVAVGGDGTLHMVLNLMLADGNRERTLGLIPVGTGSDLARGLGLARRPERALRQALEAQPAPLDVLRLDAAGGTRYFVNETSLGITTMVAARVNAQAKRSTAAFLAAALRELAGYRPQQVRIRIDGQPWREGLFYMAVVANGSHFGKGMRIAPRADPCDGLADVVVVEAVAKARVLCWLPTIYLGKHVAAPFVHCARGRVIEIDTGSEARVFEGDGELALPAPAVIRLVPGAVPFRGIERIAKS